MLKIKNESSVELNNELRTKNDCILNENDSLREKLVVLQKEKDKLARDSIHIPNYVASKKELVEL